MKSVSRNPVVPLVAALGLAAIALPTGHAAMPNPDFTRGGTIPKEAPKDWNLGATGMRGWMDCENLETSKARQIAVTQVAAGSPADGVIQVGDVILGIGGVKFSSDPRTAFGKALTAAESTAGNGELPLLLWRQGKQEPVTLKLPVLGDYSATAPFDCPKSKRIFDDGCAALARRMEDPGYGKGQNPITRSLNAMALLASGDRHVRTGPAAVAVTPRGLHFSRFSRLLWQLPRCRGTFRAAG